MLLRALADELVRELFQGDPCTFRRLDVPFFLVAVELRELQFLALELCGGDRLVLVLDEHDDALVVGDLSTM